MSLFILFGVSALDVEAAAISVNKALGIKLQARRSGMIGDYYGFGLGAGETLKLKFKIVYDQEDHYPTEPDFPDWNVFLYLDDTSEDSSMLAAIKKNPSVFTRLRTKTV